MYTPGIDGFNFQRNVFCIDDVLYDYAPEAFIPQYGEGYGVVGDSFMNLTLGRTVVVQPSKSGVEWRSYDAGESTDSFTDTTVATKLAWQGNWNQTSWMSMCMRDHLYGLYYTQRPFWIQFDEEFSFDGLVLASLDTDNKTFKLPTNPVAYFTDAIEISDEHYGVYPYIQIFDYTTNMLIAWNANPYRIDLDSGYIRFENAVSGGKIKVKYLWRAYVRVKEIDLNPTEWAQHVYGGTVMFEQVPAPVTVSRFDNAYVLEKCAKTEDDIEDYGDPGTTLKCPCYYTDVVLGSPNIFNTSCLSATSTYNNNNVILPTGHYVTGIEVLEFIGGRASPCGTVVAGTQAKFRLKLNAPGSTYSSYQTKDTQTDVVQDHAVINHMDTPLSLTDFTFGGKNDLLGKSFGTWDYTNVNSYGFLYDFSLVASNASNCSAYTPGSFSQTLTSGITTVTKKNNLSVPPTSSVGDSVAGNVLTLPSCVLADNGATSAVISAEGDGTVTIDVTGPAGITFTTIDLVLAITLKSNATNSAGRKYTITTSLGDQSIDANSNNVTVTFTKTVRVDMNAGVGQLVIPLFYYASATFNALPVGQSYTYQVEVSGSLTSTPGNTCTEYFDINNAKIRIHHAKACSTPYKFHTSALGTLSSSTATPILGTNGTTLRSSDDTTSGVGKLYLRSFGFQTFPYNSKFVGMILKMRGRKVGTGVGVGASLITNGDFSLGNTGFLSQYNYLATDPIDGNLDERAYAVVTNPHSVHSAWDTNGDHTTGSGNMLVVNGHVGTNTVSGDWLLTWTPMGVQTATGVGSVSLTTNFTITATYIGSSPIPPDSVVVNIAGISKVSTSYSVMGLYLWDFATTDGLGQSGANSSHGAWMGLIPLPSGSNIVATASGNADVTISLSAGTGSTIITMTGGGSAYSDTGGGPTPMSCTASQEITSVTFVSSMLDQGYYFWGQDIALLAATQYTLSFWYRRVYTGTNYATIRIRLNGVDIGGVVASNGNWQQYTVQFTTAGAGTYQLRFHDTSLQELGNDFAIDDIVLTSPATTGVIRCHVGVESDLNPSKLFNLPNDDSWVEYTMGTVSDDWGYHTVDSETGKICPTKIGNDLNTFYGVSMEITNAVNTHYEFELIRSQVYFVDVCDGL